MEESVPYTSLQVFISVCTAWPLPRSRLIPHPSPRKVPPAHPRQHDHNQVRQRKSLLQFLSP